MDNYIVKENKEIEEQLTEYFQKKNDSNLLFMFSHIGYTYKYFGEKSILDLNNGGKIKKIQEDIIGSSLAHIPILVPNEKDMSYGQFMKLNSCLKIDEIIDLDTDEETVKNKLFDAIRRVLPPEVIIIDDNQLDNALKDLGYTTYQFNFESLGALGDGRIVTEFEGEREGIDEKKHEVHDISEIQEIIPDRRQSEVYKILSEFINDNKQKDEHTKED